MKHISNYKGGLVGIIIILLFTVIVYFIGFMTALGNDTPMARKILDFIILYIKIANPIWTFLIAYIFGSFYIRLNSKKR